MVRTDIFQVDRELLKTEELIILSAMKIFSQYPMDVASFRMIAKDAGVSVSLITYHFKSKENLYREVLRRVAEHSASYLKSYEPIVDGKKQLTPLEAARTLEEVLAGYSDRFFAGTELDPYVLIIMQEHSAPTPHYDILYDRLFTKIFNLLTTLIIVSTGRDSHRRASFHAVAILGQLLGFRYERHILARSLGMTCYSKEEAEEIKEEILRNVFLQLEIPRPSASRQP